MSPDNARILKHKESFGLQRIGEDTSWPKMPLLKIKIAVSLCIVDNVAGDQYLTKPFLRSLLNISVLFMRPLLMCKFLMLSCQISLTVTTFTTMLWWNSSVETWLDHKDDLIIKTTNCYFKII